MPTLGPRPATLMPQGAGVNADLNSRLTALTSDQFPQPLGPLEPKRGGSPTQLNTQRPTEDPWLHDPSPFPWLSGEKGNGVMWQEVLDSDPKLGLSAAV